MPPSIAYRPQLDQRQRVDDEPDVTLHDVVHSIDELKTVIGTAPDKSTGSQGGGMRGQIAKVVDAQDEFTKGLARLARLIKIVVGIPALVVSVATIIHYFR